MVLNYFAELNALHAFPRCSGRVRQISHVHHICVLFVYIFTGFPKPSAAQNYNIHWVFQALLSSSLALSLYLSLCASDFLLRTDTAALADLKITHFYQVFNKP